VWRRKLVALATGTAALMLLNVFRIVTVFLVGVYAPQYFITIHEEVWSGLLVMATLALGLGSIAWITRGAVPAAPWQAGLIPITLRRFAVVFGLLLIPWPGLTEWCGQALRDAGTLVFTSPRGAREITFEQQGYRGTRLVIVNRQLMNGDGSGPVRNLDFNTLSVIWRPGTLLLALVIFTPMSTGRRIQALGLGAACLLLYVFLTFDFTIWNESTEVSLTTLSPFWKSVTNQTQSALMENLGLAVPVLIWLVAAVRKAAPERT
jgi:hypothetical protein